MMKKILISSMLMLITMSAWAIPARPGQWKTIKLSDGSEVRVELKGDEHCHYWQAEDGRCFYAKSIEEVQGSRSEVRGSRSEVQGSRLEVAAAPARVLGKPHTEPVSGSMKGLVVLVQFSDVKFQSGHDVALYDKILNGKDYKDLSLGFQGSVNDYFMNQSDGQLDYQFDIKGPVTLSNKATYYGGESGFDNMKEFVTEVLDLIKDDTNFSLYDNDGDHYVDEIFFLFAGKGSNDGGTNCIWPHMYWYKNSWGGSFKQNRTWVDTYACANEVQKYGNINGIGPFCHEFSHCLDIPDMYDTTASTNPLGGYSLMDIGCYNGSTYVPAGYNAYEKEFCGWRTIEELTEDATFTNIKGISEGGTAYKMTNKAQPDEYFIVEPRSQTGWDEDIAAPGFLIYHVDYTHPADWTSNIVNTVSSNHAGHYDLSIVKATSGTTFEASYPFPCGTADSFDDNTQVSSELFYENSDGTLKLHKGVYDMKKNYDGTFSFRFECDPEYTGIEEVEEFQVPGSKSSMSSKVVEGGRLVIMANGKRFNAAGQRVREF